MSCPPKPLSTPTLPTFLLFPRVSRRFKCQAYSVLPGPSPGLFPGGFLLDLLSKREGILADTLPSESPLGSVDTLVFFPGSFTLALGSTQHKWLSTPKCLWGTAVDEGEDRSQARITPAQLANASSFLFVCFYVLICFGNWRTVLSLA